MTRGVKAGSKKLINVMAELAKFADTYKTSRPWHFTHFQPAQPTTVGKRATLWLHDLCLDLEDLDYVLGSMKLLGSQGNHRNPGKLLELF